MLFESQAKAFLEPTHCHWMCGFVLAARASNSGPVRIALSNTYALVYVYLCPLRLLSLKTCTPICLTADNAFLSFLLCPSQAFTRLFDIRDATR